MRLEFLIWFAQSELVSSLRSARTAFIDSASDAKGVSVTGEHHFRIKLRAKS